MDVAYKQNVQSGVSFDLPKYLKVKGRIPNVYAKSKQPPSGIAIEADVNDELWDASLRMHEDPLPINPDLTTGFVRRGPINRPYSGHELVVESVVKQTSQVSWIWDVVFVAKGRRFSLQIFGVGSFSDAEPTWRHVIESFRVEPD